MDRNTPEGLLANVSSSERNAAVTARTCEQRKTDSAPRLQTSLLLRMCETCKRVEGLITPEQEKGRSTDLSGPQTLVDPDVVGSKLWIQVELSNILRVLDAGQSGERGLEGGGFLKRQN
ncbi:hypothetical protein FQA47_021061 [Oryzias melastigma]|uniref:Uncharacterized protein n=1 Tax=Oryzias melastigma TaxID=30732 RepID=A0A834BY84_ORYME|nr:hypothetical protein FQA47_021061 [Oryzias melastigma]